MNATDASFKSNKLIPNESKWDIVYCIPFYAKPGKHTYMVKYKNTQDRTQKKNLQKRDKVRA